jgi:energy-coupling factor transporter ATP-binding protein EcfA2
MEIAEIKSRLSLSKVISYYGLKPDKQARLLCPFHADKTPSLQLYYKTQTAYCFSSACPTHGKSMDVIDFIMYRENCTKHEAITKAKNLLGVENENLQPENHPAVPVLPNSEISREQFLTSIFQYFKNAVHNSKPARDYLESRRLDYRKIEVGYNGGQFHHGKRREEKLIEGCLQYGLLLDKNILARTGEKAFGVFGKWCICFALKNQPGEVVSLYFRSTLDAGDNKHFYLKNRQGLYPGYPSGNTKTLILTESIIDAASLPITNYELEITNVLACYGTNGLTEEHRAAIAELKELQEIIFAFDMDSAGREAVKKYAAAFRSEYPGLKITTLDLPGKDVNETLQGHDESIFAELLNNRKEIFLSNGKPVENKKSKTSAIQSAQEENRESPQITDSLSFLSAPRLLHRLNGLIGQAGIVGEDESRMLLFLIVISYVNKQPLHALVQGSSGSGKTHIINRIADLMPPEDVLRFTRITESSLYNWGEFDLFGKVVVIEDLDGLKEDALYALREFISNQILRSSITIKDKKGNNRSQHKIVKGQFSSLSATTKGETYEDNMNRSFLLAVDESREQTQKIIDYQNRRIAGVVSPDEQTKTILFIQGMVRKLKHYEIINPYATKLFLPDKVHKVRRLNEMYQSVIKQVTFLNQYRRKHTEDNRLITEIEDIEQATEILFESIVLKVDELDGSLRQFFERLKKYVKDEGKEFILRDVRQHLNISKTQLFRYMQSLTELEYVKQSGGYFNTGIKYRIVWWDNYQKIRAEVKAFLLKQIEQLKAV